MGRLSIRLGFACLCFAASAGSIDNELETIYISTFEDLKYLFENGNQVRIVLSCNIEGDEELITGESTSIPQEEKTQIILDLNGYTLTVNNYIYIDNEC